MPREYELSKSDIQVLPVKKGSGYGCRDSQTGINEMDHNWGIMHSIRTLRVVTSERQFGIKMYFIIWLRLLFRPLRTLYVDQRDQKAMKMPYQSMLYQKSVWILWSSQRMTKVRERLISFSEFARQIQGNTVGLLAIWLSSSCCGIFRTVCECLSPIRLGQTQLSNKVVRTGGIFCA